MSETSRLLSVPQLGAGHGVRLGVVPAMMLVCLARVFGTVGIDLPLVEGDTGVVGLVETGDLDRRGEFAGTGRLNLQLEALHVELSLADMALVDGDVLNADKVLASRNALLDGPLKAVLLPAVPGSVDTGLAGVDEAALHDLGPVTAAIVAGDAARGLGDVDEARAGVLDLLVESELEANLVTGLDGVGGNTSSLGSLVAPQVGGVDDVGSERGHVGVGVLAGVSIVTTNGLVVDHEAVEDVVRIDRQGRKKREDD